ncbi:YetF domain-containing protein [Pedobacter deserti]|uniref:YetF domain-containing protein n=1 Tax=Pedobacter deserti TaxID=2817382 RepID=UPI00210F0152|nr:YetF domain-containing protein [Pedobacter sp. SYSU D00382]
MLKEEILWTDWYRILVGNAPAIFLVEVLIRTVITYVLLLFILRYMGKRMSGQLTLSEMAVMITLGAIVSVPMQMPERGILHGLLILLCALAFQRGLGLLGFKNAKAEEVINGRESLLIKDGVLQIDTLTKEKISRQQLYAVLRNKGIFNLGEVERLYLEACGLFNVYKFREPRPGLSVLPPEDREVQNILAMPERMLACEVCGHIQEQHEGKHEHCSNCKKMKWQPAIQ